MLSPLAGIVMDKVERVLYVADSVSLASNLFPHPQTMLHKTEKHFLTMCHENLNFGPGE